MSCPGVPTLTYTNDDDGVWLQCDECEWERNIGHHCSPSEAHRISLTEHG